MTERMKFVTGDKTTQAQDSNQGPLFHTQKVRQVDTSLSHSHSTTTNSELVNGPLGSIESNPKVQLNGPKPGNAKAKF